ncbi:MAG TPA: hypothetical protein VFP12_00545 [Allosphingosinicella sp.]|nr:hypothetical protein [Allosphingosinicella sp.]
MYMNPGGDTPGFSYGVLRRVYRGQACSVGASEFVRRKLYPIEAPPEGDWSKPFTCSRWDVVLPPSGSDEYMAPERLMEAYERHLLSWRQGLLCTIKVAQPLTEPLQSSYERIRAVARQALPLSRNLPAILIAHAPFLAGVNVRMRQPHVHIVALASELSLLGWGAPNDEVTSDAGHLALYEEFKAADAIT